MSAQQIQIDLIKAESEKQKIIEIFPFAQPSETNGLSAALQQLNDNIGKLKIDLLKATQNNDVIPEIQQTTTPQPKAQDNKLVIALVLLGIALIGGGN